MALRGNYDSLLRVLQKDPLATLQRFTEGVARFCSELLTGNDIHYRRFIAAAERN